MLCLSVFTGYIAGCSVFLLFPHPVHPHPRPPLPLPRLIICRAQGRKEGPFLFFLNPKVTEAKKKPLSSISPMTCPVRRPGGGTQGSSEDNVCRCYANHLQREMCFRSCEPMTRPAAAATGSSLGLDPPWVSGMGQPGILSPSGPRCGRLGSPPGRTCRSRMFSQAGFPLLAANPSS